MKAPNGWISHDLLIWNELDRRGFVAAGFTLDVPDLRHASEHALDSFYESVRQFLRTLEESTALKSAGRSIPITGTRSSRTRPSPTNAASRTPGRPSRETNASTATGARCRPASFAGKSWFSFSRNASRSILRLRRARTTLALTISASSRNTAKLSTSTDGSLPHCSSRTEAPFGRCPARTCSASKYLKSCTTSGSRPLPSRSGFRMKSNSICLETGGFR
jgi:hypothetical protein